VHGCARCRHDTANPERELNVVFPFLYPRTAVVLSTVVLCTVETKDATVLGIPRKKSVVVYRKMGIFYDEDALAALTGV
jgi:hypothetical protein